MGAKISSHGIHFVISLLLSAVLLCVSCQGGSGSLASAVEQESALLPQLPVDTAGDVLRNASAVESLPGNAAILFENGMVDQSNMVLTSGRALAWAMYRFEGLAGKTVEAVSIQLIPGSLTSQYTVGIGDYNSNSWEWLATSSVPEFEFDLTTVAADIISRLGNLYLVVVVDGGDTVTLETLNIFSADPPGPLPPVVSVDCNELVIDSPTDIYKVKVVDGDNQAFREYNVGTHFEYTTPSGIYIIQVFVRMNQGDDYLVYEFPVPDELLYGSDDGYYRCIVDSYFYVDDLKRARIWDASGDQFAVDTDTDSIYFRHPNDEDLVRVVYYFDCGRIERDLSYPDNPRFDVEFTSSSSFRIEDLNPDIYKVRIETDDGNVERIYHLKHYGYNHPPYWDWSGTPGINLVSVKIRPTPGDEYLVYLPGRQP